MRKSIYLLLTLLITSTSFSNDICLKVSEAHGTTEGYLVLKIDQESNQFYMDENFRNANEVLDAYSYAKNFKRPALEYWASKSDKEIMICYKDFEVNNDKTVSRRSELESIEIKNN